jgi:hypothetical protein
VTTSGATDAVPTDAPNARKLAQRLVARVAMMNSAPRGAASTVLVACQDTHRALVRSIGSVGADALMSRALTIAEKQHPLLREIPFDREDKAGLAVLEAVVEKHGRAASSGALESLLELLLSLLERFVGIDVVVRLVAQSETIGTKEDEDAQ